MTATITITRGQLGVFDATTGRVGGLQSGTTIYSGKARIHTVSGEGSISIGEGQIDQRQAIISIPWDASPVPARDDLIVVSDDGNLDADMVSRSLRVVEVEGGSLFFDARRLSCVSWYPSRHWTG